MSKSEFIVQAVMNMHSFIPDGIGSEKYVELVGRPCPSPYSDPVGYHKWWAEAEACVRVMHAMAIADKLGPMLSTSNNS